MIVSKSGFLALNDLWSWPISSRSFSHDFAIKPLKYIPSCCVHSTARTVLDGLFPYLAQMITNMSKVCRVQRPLTLTYIFKAIQPWLWWNMAHLLVYAVQLMQFWMDSFPIFVYACGKRPIESQCGNQRIVCICGWGGVILVDHRFTISSSKYENMIVQNELIKNHPQYSNKHGQ